MKQAIVIVLLVCVCLAAYHNSLRSGFTYDDHGIIVGNHFLTRARYLGHLLHVWDQSYYEKFLERSYRPVVTLSYFMDYGLWRLRPFGYHLVNLLCHAGTVVLLFILLLQVFGKAASAFAGAALYAVHPALTEAINSIAFREDILAGLFVCGSFVSYVQWRRAQRRGLPWAIVSVALFIAALLSKESAIVLAAFLVLYEICFAPDGRRAFSSFPLYGLFMAIALLYGYLRMSILQYASAPPHAYPGGSFYTNVLTMPKVLASYLRIAIIPTHLSIDHVVEPETAFFRARVIGPMLVILLYLGALVISARRSKVVFFALGWFAAGLLPVANIVPIKNVLAERYLYIPLMAVAFLVAGIAEWAAALSAERRARVLEWGTVAGLAVIAGAFMTLTIQRNPIWRDDASLWSYPGTRFPGSAQSQAGKGFSLLRQDKPAEAIPYLREAVRLYQTPFWIARAHFNLGGAYERMDMLEEAVAEFRKAIELDPMRARYHTALGATLHRMGRLDEAERELKKALIVDHYELMALWDLGALQLRRGEPQKAIATFNRALDLDPRSLEPRANLGLALLRSGETDEAIRHFEIAAKQAPGNAQLHLHLGTALALKGNFGEAQRHYEEASRLDPDDPVPHRQLGGLYGRFGLFTRALHELSLALEMGSKDATIFVDLGSVYISLDRQADAVAAYREFLKRRPTDDPLCTKVQEKLDLLAATSSDTSAEQP